jgi:hypothetical protein
LVTELPLCRLSITKEELWRVGAVSSCKRPTSIVENTEKANDEPQASERKLLEGPLIQQLSTNATLIDGYVGTLPTPVLIHLLVRMRETYSFYSILYTIAILLPELQSVRFRKHFTFDWPTYLPTYLTRNTGIVQTNLFTLCVLMSLPHRKF